MLCKSGCELKSLFGRAHYGHEKFVRGRTLVDKAIMGPAAGGLSGI
jgi:hypothetical protein